MQLHSSNYTNQNSLELFLAVTISFTHNIQSVRNLRWCYFQNVSKIHLILATLTATTQVQAIHISSVFLPQSLLLPSSLFSFYIISSKEMFKYNSGNLSFLFTLLLFFFFFNFRLKVNILTKVYMVLHDLCSSLPF